MADWGSIIGGLSPLAFGAAGALTAQPNTNSSTKQNTFLTPQSEGLFNQGTGLAAQAGQTPYAANSWIENAQRMLGATALDNTTGDVFGQTSETIGGLANQLGSMQGGANWNANPGAMTSAVQANMNPWNTLVRDQTMQYAQEAADRGNAQDRAAASANASQFGDRSQIAMELAKDKRQQGLNALQSNLNQTGFNNALAQTNVNNALGRADIGQQVGLALQQPSLAQQNRANQIGNAQLLMTEGTAQRDYPWQQANNLINAGTKGMGSTSLNSTSVNPWTTGISAGLSALNPAVQSGVSAGVNALGSIFGAGTSAAASSIPTVDFGFSNLGDASQGLGNIGSDFFSGLFKRGGRVKNFRSGGLARFADGGQEAEDVPYEELPPFDVTDGREGQTTGELPSDVVVGGAAALPRFAPTADGRRVPIPPQGDRMSAGDLEAEYMRRLMQAPDPAEMRTARDDERRAMSALLAEYKPRANDSMRALSDLGVGMADPENRSFGNAFARGVGRMQAGIDQRDQLDRQAKRELAQIQLKMASENRKELTETERTRLTTLASMIRERNQSEQTRALREATLAQTAAQHAASNDLARARIEEMARQHDMMALMHQQGLDMREASMVAPLVNQLRTQAATSIDAQLKANGETMDESARNALIEQRVTEGLPGLLSRTGINPRRAGAGTPPAVTGPLTVGGSAVPPAAPPANAPAVPAEAPPPAGAPEAPPPAAAAPAVAAPPPVAVQPPTPAPAVAPAASRSGLPGARPAPAILPPPEVAKQTAALTSSMRTFENVEEGLNKMKKLSQEIPDNLLKSAGARAAAGWGANFSGKAPQWATNADEYEKLASQLIIDLQSTMTGGGRPTDALRSLIEKSKPEIAKTQAARAAVIDELITRIKRERAYANHAYGVVSNKGVMPSFDDWLKTYEGAPSRAGWSVKPKGE